MKNSFCQDVVTFLAWSKNDTQFLEPNSQTRSSCANAMICINLEIISFSQEGTRLESCPESPCSPLNLLFWEQRQKQ